MVVVHETNKKVISGIVHIRAYIKTIRQPKTPHNKKINEFGPFPTMVVVHETNKKVISGIVHIRAYIKNNTST